MTEDTDDAETDENGGRFKGPKEGWLFRSAEEGGTLTKTFFVDDLTVEVRIVADLLACAGEISDMCDHIDRRMK